MRDIDKPVPYALTEAGIRYLEALPVVEDRPDGDEELDAEIAAYEANPDNPPIGVAAGSGFEVELGAELARRTPAGAATAAAVEIWLCSAPFCMNETEEPRSWCAQHAPAGAAAAAAALGRSPAVIPGQKDGMPKNEPSAGNNRPLDEGGPRAGNEGGQNDLTPCELCGRPAPDHTVLRGTVRCPEAPIQGAPAIETSTRKDEDEDEPEPACMRCLQLRTELEQHRKDFRTLSRPFLAQFPTMSANQVQLFQEKLKPIAERVRVAKNALELHRRNRGCV